VRCADFMNFANGKVRIFAPACAHQEGDRLYRRAVRLWPVGGRPWMMYVAGRTGGQMTTEEFAEAVDKLITAAREGGLSDAEMIVVLEDAVERLE
jgi:hypothetical protein